MRRKPELMQLEMGMSTSRYLPASGTAGFARSLVSGNSRVPCPPPMMTERTLLTLIVWRLLCNINRMAPAIYCQLPPQGKPRICELTGSLESESLSGKPSTNINLKKL